METLYFLGIDISKKSFHGALTVDGMNMYQEEVGNTSKQINSFFQTVKKKFGISNSQFIVCMEHTGIYCLPLLDHLVKMNIKVCVEPALQIKRSQGITRGKSDKIDASRIAQYAFKNQRELRFWKPQRTIIQKVKALLVVRDRLVKTKTQLEVPLRESQEFIEESIRKMIIKNCQCTLKALEKDILKIEVSINRLIEEDIQLRQQVVWASSVTGIGKLTALNIIIASGEFQRIREAKKLSCYAGVAPFEHTSGSSIKGKTRVSKMANMNLKRLLHLAAMSAIQCSEEMNTYYRRKVDAGKNKMSVINAVRNKLISRVYACVKQQKMYEKNYNRTLV